MLWTLVAVQAALTRQKQQYEDEMAALRSNYDQQIEAAAAKHRAELEVRTKQYLPAIGNFDVAVQAELTSISSSSESLPCSCRHATCCPYPCPPPSLMPSCYRRCSER